MRLTDLLALSHVPRWTIVPMLRPQTVADHSFRVAVILRELADRLGIALDTEDFWMALWHDGGESRSGDIPGVFKKEIAETIKAREYEMCPWLEVQPQPIYTSLIKLADLIETATYIHRYGSGPHAHRVYDYVYSRIQTQVSDLNYDYGVIEQLIKDIQNDEGREPNWSSYGR